MSPNVRLIRALVPALALASVAVWEFLCAGSTAGVASGGDWARASQHVRDGFRDGDLIVAAPAWLDPLVRLHLGDRIPLEVAGRMDAARFAVIWEVSARGADSPDTHELTPVAEHAFGALRVRRFEREPAVVVTDFVAEAAAGRVRQSGRAVGALAVRLEEVGFEPHRCVRIVPRPGQTASGEFPRVTLGRTLVGYVGLADVFKRRDVRDPATLAVQVNGIEVARVEVGVDDGWVRFSADTAPGPARVVFSATAADPGARDRLVCFAAEARK